MKKIIVIFCSTLLLSNYAADAQQTSGNSFVLTTYGTNMRVPNSWPASNFFSQQNGSYLFVHSKNPTSAMRYGIGVGQRYNSVNSSSFVRNDTSYLVSNYIESSVPRLIVGKEWRKNLHPDVMIIGGGDVSIGGGSVRMSERVESEFENGTAININSQRQGFSIYGAFTPFTGLRVSWGRLALGYAASLPIELDAIFQKNSTIQSLNMQFAHNLSIGYRIFNTKK